MFLSRSERIGWGIAVLIVAVMGVLVWHGPFNKVAKTAAAPVGKPVHVKIVTDKNLTIVGDYVPKMVTVRTGQQVIFDNVSNVAHTVTATNQAFNSGNLPNGSSWTLIAPKPGTYKYNCLYHPHMLGTLVVKS